MFYYHFFDIIASHLLFVEKEFPQTRDGSHGKNYESSDFDMLTFIAIGSQGITSLVLESL